MPAVIQPASPHARDRLLERYGVPLTPGLVEALIAKIQAGRSRKWRPWQALPHELTAEARFIRRGCFQLSRETWRVVHEGVEFQLTYDNRTRAVITFLPPPARMVPTCQP